jgi:hypothetical protein
MESKIFLVTKIEGKGLGCVKPGTLILREKPCFVLQPGLGSDNFDTQYLIMSRFNHACVSNAEYFWNEDVKARDITAIR